MMPMLYLVLCLLIFILLILSFVRLSTRLKDSKKKQVFDSGNNLIGQNHSRFIYKKKNETVAVYIVFVIFLLVTPWVIAFGKNVNKTNLLVIFVGLLTSTFVCSFLLIANKGKQ